jgi:ABC-type multidrug transport system fused ATPase/permease subunit
LQPKILVLDEATSALDGATERDIIAAIERIRSDRTTIVIAHRLSTVRNCDRILLVAEGRVLEGGTWDELYERNAQFRRLVLMAQTEDASIEAAANVP